ncbi:MAG TPA: BON domain-containing protein [Verrucomicrobiae bacterium]|nr:BON domain-containing protein [Verrucomicrobiae bacterium]
MKDFFIGLIVGAFLTAGTGWYFVYARKDPRVAHAWDAMNAKLTAWHLSSSDIQTELSHTGRVLRRQATDFGAAVSSASSDTAITAKIKAKYALDRDLSVFGISVNTTDGRVTLAGDVASHQQIGKAMMIALDTEGVREVNSTLQVKRQAKAK